MIPVLGLFSLVLGGGFKLVQSLQLWRAQPGQLNGQDYQHSGLFGHRSTSNLLGIQVPYRTTFTCRLETWFDRWAKRWGLSQELQWGHPELDRNLYIVADSRPVQEIMSGNPELATLLLSLMDCQAHGVTFHSLTCHRGRLWVKFTRTKLGLSPIQSADLVLKCVPILQAIAKAFEHPEVNTSIFWIDRAHGMALALGMLSSSLLVYGLIEIRDWESELSPKLLPNSDFQWHAITLSIALTALMLGLVFKLVRGTSRAHWTLLEVLLTGGIGLTMLTFSTLKEINTLNDVETARTVQAVVSEVRVVHRRQKIPRHVWQEFHIKLQANDDLPEMEFRANASVFLHAQPGQHLQLQLHPGKLGYPWVSNPQLLDN